MTGWVKYLLGVGYFILFLLISSYYAHSGTGMGNLTAGEVSLGYQLAAVCIGILLYIHFVTEVILSKIRELTELCNKTNNIN